MSSFQNDLFMPPPGPGNLGWRPMGDNGDGRMNMPIVVALILSIVLFILFLWFFLSPHFVQRDVSQTPPRPIDLEDAYFVDENTSRTSPYAWAEHMRKAAPYRVARSIASPPPAYSWGPSLPSYPGSSSARPLFSRSNSSSTAGGVHRRSSFRRLLDALPRLTRSASAPPVISKPIPLPEFPLPGPEVLTESDARRTTVVHPPAAPSRSVSDSMLHPPSAHLPAPSQAVVHNGTTRRPLTVSQQSLAYLNASSARYSQFPGAPDLDASVASSRIGLAL